jgi:hypothetical protein
VLYVDGGWSLPHVILYPAARRLLTPRVQQIGGIVHRDMLQCSLQML